MTNRELEEMIAEVARDCARAKQIRRRLGLAAYHGWLVMRLTRRRIVARLSPKPSNDNGRPWGKR